MHSKKGKASDAPAPLKNDLRFSLRLRMVVSFVSKDVIGDDRADQRLQAVILLGEYLVERFDCRLIAHAHASSKCVGKQSSRQRSRELFGSMVDQIGFQVLGTMDIESVRQRGIRFNL